MSDLEPLSELTRGLLREEQEASFARDALRLRVRSRLVGALGEAFAPTPDVMPAPDAPLAPEAPTAPQAGLAAASPAAGGATKALTLTAGKLAGIVAISVTVGAVSAVSVDRSLRDTTLTPSPTATASLATPPMAPVTTVPASMPSSVHVELLPAASGAKDVAAKPSPSASSEVAGSDLVRERSIIDAARAAVRKGDGDTALEAVRRHERAFPSGRLREERESIRILALVTLGRRDEANRLLERFRTSHPESLFLPQLEAALARSAP